LRLVFAFTEVVLLFIEDKAFLRTVWFCRFFGCGQLFQIWVSSSKAVQRDASARHDFFLRLPTLQKINQLLLSFGFEVCDRARALL
jgi:hypothetical protein